MTDSRDRPTADALADLEIQVAPGHAQELRIVADDARAYEALKRLRDDPEAPMQRLVDLTAVDRSGAGEGFEVVYRLHSPGTNRVAILRVPVASAEAGVDSVVWLWPAANWLEREVFDLFGIRFRTHPDLRRILLEPDFEGAPLRKDYPRQPDLPVPPEDRT